MFKLSAFHLWRHSRLVSCSLGPVNYLHFRMIHQTFYTFTQILTKPRSESRQNIVGSIKSITGYPNLMQKGSTLDHKGLNLIEWDIVWRIQLIQRKKKSYTSGWSANVSRFLLNFDQTEVRIVTKHWQTHKPDHGESEFDIKRVNFGSQRVKFWIFGGRIGVVCINDT